MSTIKKLITKDNTCVVTQKSVTMEDIIQKFPLISKQIFEKLESKSLGKCRIVGRSWLSFIEKEKFPWIQMVERHVNYPERFLNKSLKISDLQAVKMMAITARQYRNSYPPCNDKYVGGQSSLHFAVMSKQVM